MALRGKLRRWLIKKFGKPGEGERKRTYETPPDREFLEEHLPEATQKHIAKLEAKVDKQEEKIEELKKKREEEEQKRIEAEAEAVAKIQQQYKELKRENRIILPFSKDVRLLLNSKVDNGEFFRGDGREYREWRGIILEKGPNGTPMFSFLISDGGDRYGKLGSIPLPKAGFAFPKSVINDAKTGVVSVNLRKDGVFMDPVEGAKIAESSNPGQKTMRNGGEPEGAQGPQDSIKRMREIDPKAFDRLYDRLRELEAKVMEAERREKHSLYEKMQADIEKSGAEEIAENALDSLAKMKKRQAELEKREPKREMELMDAKLKSSASESLVQAMWKRYKELLGLLEKAKSGDKELAERLEGLGKDIKSLRREIQSAKRGLPASKPEEVRE